MQQGQTRFRAGVEGPHEPSGVDIERAHTAAVGDVQRASLDHRMQGPEAVDQGQVSAVRRRLRSEPVAAQLVVAGLPVGDLARPQAPRHGRQVGVLAVTGGASAPHRPTRVPSDGGESAQGGVAPGDQQRGACALSIPQVRGHIQAHEATAITRGGERIDQSRPERGVARRVPQSLVKCQRGVAGPA